MKTKRISDPQRQLKDRYHKLLYWLYRRQDDRRARGYADQIANLLFEIDADKDAIFPEECRSLICEARGDLVGAVKHREREIRLIKRLHEISRNRPHQKLIFALYGYDDLSDRLDLLAILYHDAGHPDKALNTLRASKRLCEKHGIPFDGEDILEEYLAERANGRTNSHRVNGSRRDASKV